MLSTHTNSQHGKNPLSPRKSPALAAAPGDTAPPADPVDPLASSPHHQHHHHHQHEHGSAGAAGGRPASSSSGAAATTLAQRLELVARRFVSNVVGWPGGSGGGGGGSGEEEEERSGEEQPREGDVGSGDIETAARVASMMLAPGAAVHVGGMWADVLAPGQPNNEDALFEYLSRERAAYQLLELQPLAVAVAVDSEPVAVAGLGGGGAAVAGGCGGAAADPTPTAAAAAHGREVVEEGEKLERRDGAGAGGGACGGGGAAAGGSGGGDVAFVLSRFRMKHVGGWLGRAPTGRVSEGLRVDELRFDPEAKIAAAWCTRQLTQEELEVLRARPEGGEGAGAGEGAAHAKAPALEPSLLRLQASELAPHKMMQVAALWSQAWNVATDAGAVNPDLLDCLAEPTLTATDMSGLGLGGGGGSGGGVGGGGGGGGEEQQHPFTAIRSRNDAKAALAALCASYEVDEGLVTAAAARGTNAAFCHWRARLTPRRRGGGSSGSTQDAATPQPGGGSLPATIIATADAGSGSSGGGHGSSSGGGGHGPGSYVAEGVDLLLFAPSGKLQAIAQFRRPLGWERRTLLSAAGLAAAMAEAGVAEAAAVAKGPGVCVVDNAPAGAPEGIIA